MSAIEKHVRITRVRQSVYELLESLIPFESGVGDTLPSWAALARHAWRAIRIPSIANSQYNNIINVNINSHIKNKSLNTQMVRR